MIANRIRRGQKQNRPIPRKLARQILALLTYVAHADPRLMIEAAKLDGYIGYALDVEMKARGVKTGEKVIAHGCLNLEGDDLADWNVQMISTALQCARSKHPLEHIVISWQSGEQPTAAELAEAVFLMAESLGCARNQIVWAAHGNTDNIHVHMIINRIDPKTLTATQLGDGWDQDRLAQGCAIIQARQGWRSEGNADYFATEQGEVWSFKEEKIIRTEDGIQTRSKGDRAATLEAWRAKPEIAAITKILLETTDWQSLHRELAKCNATFLKKVGGAAIVIEREEIKASRFGRECSMKALLIRMQEFEKPHVLSPALQGHAHHQAALFDLEAELRASRDTTLLKLRHQGAVSLARLCSQVRTENARLEQEEALKMAAAAARWTICNEYQLLIETVRKAKLTESEWARGRRRAIPKVAMPTILLADTASEISDDSLSEYARWRVAGGTQYRRGGCAEPSFTDYQLCIMVHVSTDKEVIDALRLAANRWKIVDVTGPREFQKQCARLAEEHGIEVTGKHIRRPSDGRVRIDIALLAMVRDVFHQTNWRRSDYPEIAPDEAVTLDNSVQSRVPSQGGTAPHELSSPTPAAIQNTAVRPAFPAADLSW